MTKIKKDLLSDIEKRIKEMDLDNRETVADLLREISNRKTKKPTKLLNIAEAPSRIQ